MKPDPMARNWDGIPRVVHVLATSEPACDRAVSVVSEAAGRANRRVSIDPRIFGNERLLPALRQPLDGCAAVVALSGNSAGDGLFTSAVRALVEQSAARDDFRVYLLLDNLTAEQFHALAGSRIEPFDLLHDNIQLTAGLREPDQSGAGPITDQVVASLAEMLASLRDIRDRANWRRIRVGAGIFAGRVAGAMQAVSVLVLVCGWAATRMGWSARIPVDAQALREAISLSAGIIQFWALMFPVFFILRGFSAAAAAARDTRWAVRMNTLCALILVGALRMARHAGAGRPWMLLGIAIGACVDGLRRAGLQAQRLRHGLEVHSIDPDLSGLTENLAGVGPANIFRVPLWSVVSQSVVISYARASRWSYDLATRLFSALVKNDSPVFLDREKIPVGSNWRRELQYEIGGASTFLCILDQVSLTRPWVASELFNAMRGQALTGSPRIVTLENGTLSLDQARPVFARTLEQDTPEGAKMHLVRRIRVSQRTVDVLASELTPARFQAVSVIPQSVAIIFEALIRLVTMLCAFAAMAGLLAWAGWVYEMWNNTPILHWLRPHTAIALFLFAAYLAGCGLRLAVVSRFQVQHESPAALAFVQGFSGVGLVLFCAAWFQHMPPLVDGWALVAAAFGWWRAGAFFSYSALGDEKLRRA